MLGRLELPGQEQLVLEPGRVIGLVGAAGLGLTRVGMALLAVPAQTAPVVVVDARGWFCPLAAWESGIDPDRLVVVRCPDPGRWVASSAALLEGVRAVYAEIPAGVRDQDLRRLAALARARRSGLVLRPLRGDLPAGVLHLRLRAVGVEWDGIESGHGSLGRRRLVLQASGRGAAGIERTIEVEDDGADTLRVVSGLATTAGRRAAG